MFVRKSSRIFNMEEVAGHNNEAQTDIENIDDEKNSTLVRLGKEYRKDFKKHLRNFSILYIALIGLFCFLPSVGMLLLGEHPIIVALIAVPLLIVMVAAYIKIRNNFIKELNRDNLRLGNKFKNKYKTVKGANKSTFMGIKLKCIIWLVFGALVGLPTFAITANTNAIDYSELHTITGEFLYCREQYGKYSYIAIGLSNLETEYRLSSIEEDEFNYSFLDDIEVGDELVILIDDSADRDFSIKNVDKMQWNSFYELSANGKPTLPTKII